MGIRRYSSTASVTSLNGAITGADLSLVVNNATGYPTDRFTIQVEFEIIYVGTRSGNTFSSLIRGFDGTVAAAHGNAAVVQHVATADDFDWRWGDVRLDRRWGVIDEEFTGNSLANFSQLVVTGTTTWTEGGGIMSASFGNQTVNDVNAILKSLGPLAAPPIRVETAVRVLGVLDNYLMAGPVLTNGNTSTHSAVMSMPYLTTTTGQLIYQAQSGTMTNLVTSSVSVNLSQQIGPWLYLRIEWLTTNSFSFGISCDGVSWLSYGPYTLTLTPTHVGLAVSSWGSANTKLATFEYLRVQEI